jgi:predicted metalloprotease
MRWEGRDESKNIEDRRGSAMPVAGMAGGGLLFLIFTIVISMLLGSNPRQLIEQAGQQQQSQQNRMPPSAENDKDANLKKFVGVVLKDNEDVWTKLFREKLNARYEDPKLVIFSGAVRSACDPSIALAIRMFTSTSTFSAPWKGTWEPKGSSQWRLSSRTRSGTTFRTLWACR